MAKCKALTESAVKGLKYYAAYYAAILIKSINQYRATQTTYTIKSLCRYTGHTNNMNTIQV